MAIIFVPPCLSTNLISWNFNFRLLFVSKEILLVRLVLYLRVTYLVSAAGILKDVALLPAKSLTGNQINLSQGTAEDVSS